jgi:hypothetical protein
VLAEVDRILDELDPEHRSRRLMEELDRAALRQHERYVPFGRLARGDRARLRPRRRRRLARHHTKA